MTPPIMGFSKSHALHIHVNKLSQSPFDILASELAESGAIKKISAQSLNFELELNIANNFIVCPFFNTPI